VKKTKKKGLVCRQSSPVIGDGAEIAVLAVIQLAIGDELTADFGVWPALVGDL